MSLEIENDKNLYEGNNIASAIEAGMDLSSIQKIEREEGRESTTVIVKDGYETVEIDNNLPRPLRKQGTRTFDSAKSFCSYVNKHKSEDETIIVAHEDSGKIKAILNDDGKEDPSWSDFSALLELGFSKQWLTWFENAHPKRQHFFGQEEFANFIEDNRSDLKVGKFNDSDGNEIENLSALELTALITNLEMTSQESFKSKIDPTSGRVTMSYENEEAGYGNIVLPKQIFLAIPIYRSGDLFQVTLRLRHRIHSRSAKFYFIIDQIDLLKEMAFDMICQRITDGNTGSEDKPAKQFTGTGIEVLKGSL